MGGSLRKPRRSGSRAGSRGGSTPTPVLVDEKYTKPCGLYVHKSIDMQRLRKLILAGRLAPCFTGLEEPTDGVLLEECPICMLYYPALNRSKCCNKSLCTECFLQVKSPNSQVVSCPFCKTVGYAVVFRGARTADELQRELLEDQRMIEARMKAKSADVAPSEDSSTQTPAVAVAPPAAVTADGESCPPTPLSSGPPSTPLSALPMIAAPGSIRRTSPHEEQADEDARLAAFLSSSSSSTPISAATAAGGQPGNDMTPRSAARSGRSRRAIGVHPSLHDHVPPELLAAAMREGATVSTSALEEALLMQAIWASLQDQGVPPPTSSPRQNGSGRGQQPGSQPQSPSLRRAAAAAAAAITGLSPRARVELSDNEDEDGSVTSSTSSGDDFDDDDDDEEEDSDSEEGPRQQGQPQLRDDGSVSRSLPGELHPGAVSRDNLFSRRASMDGRSLLSETSRMNAPSQPDLDTAQRTVPQPSPQAQAQAQAAEEQDADAQPQPAPAEPPWAVVENAAFEAGEAGPEHEMAPAATEAAPAGEGEAQANAG